MSSKTKEKSSSKALVGKTKAPEKEVTVFDDPADFETGGVTRDVDIKDIPSGKKRLPGEHILLTGESWVELGEAEGVPDWAVGQVAAVINSPVSHKLDENGDVLYDYTKPDAAIVVRVRSQGTTLTVPLDSCQRVAVVGGRGALVNFP